MIRWLKTYKHPPLWGGLVGLLILTGCYPTSGVEDGEQLYVGQEKIQYTASPESGNTTEAKTELEAALGTPPNGAIMGSPYHRYPFSFSYLVWTWTHNSTGKTGKWLCQKMGTMPVLVSDVNPFLRTTVATTTLKNNGFFRGSSGYKEITQADPRKAKIQYNVNFGPLFRLDSIEYRYYPDHMKHLLDSTAAESLLHKGDGFSVSTLDAERQRIATLFRNNGYYYYQSGNSSYMADTIQNPLHVQLRLQMDDSLNTQVTKQWRIGKIQMYLKRYGERTTTDSIQRRRTTIHFNGKRPPLRANILLSDMMLKKGMLYSDDLYKESVNRLSRFDTFSNIELSCKPANSADTCSTLDLIMDCTLDKLWSLNLEGNITGKTSSRIGPGANLTLTRKNPFRGAEKLSFNVYGSYEWQYGGSGTDKSQARNSYEYGYGVTLELPSLLVPKFIRRKLRKDPSTAIKLSNAVVKRGTFFNRHIFSAEFSYTYHPNDYEEHKFTPLSLEYSYMNSSSEEFDSMTIVNPYLLTLMEDKFSPQIKYSFTYTQQGKRLHPIVWSFTLAESGNLLSLGYLCAGKSWNEMDKTFIKCPYSQFLKFETNFSKYWQISERSQLVAHTNIGVVWPFGNSDQAPYSEMFYVGGANSIRAFTARSIGPGRYGGSGTKWSYIVHVGNIKFVANLEYRPRILGNLYGALFLDWGNVWYTPYDDPTDTPDLNRTIFRFKDFYKDMALGTGIGLRYDLGFFVVRVDWGIGLHMPFETGKSGYFNMNKFKDAQTINLAIGYPF